jgi:long-chain fatty acid transport protein
MIEPRAARLFVALTALGLVSMTARTAAAQALSSPNVGTTASGPVTVDPAAIHWNPANLADLTEPTGLFGIDFVLGDIRYTRERRAAYQREDSLQFALPISPANVDPSKTGKSATVRSNPFGPAPSLFGAYPLSKGLVFGFGVYAPYAAIVSFDDNGPQKWALQNATIATIYFTPSIAYRITDALALGAGLSYVLGYASLAKVQDFAAIDAVGQALAKKPIEQQNDFGTTAPAGVRELSTMARPIKLRNMIGHGFTFNVGAAVTPTDKLRLGLSYQHSVAMKFNGKFSLDMNDDFFTQDLAAQGMAFKRQVEGDATLSFTLPRAINAGISYQLSEDWGAALTGAYTWWSQVESFDVFAKSPDLAQPKLGLSDTTQLKLARNWQNTILVLGTLRWQASSEVKTWFSGGWHSAAVPDATIDAASPDGNAVIVAAGLGYSVSKKTTLIADFKLQHMIPRTVVGSNLDLANGEYKLDLYALGLYAQMSLLPGGTLCTDIHDERGRRLYGVRVRPKRACAPPPEQLIPRL